MSKLIRDKIHSTPLYREPFICMCSRKNPHNQDIRRTIQGKDQVIYCLSAEKCDQKKLFISILFQIERFNENKNGGFGGGLGLAKLI